MSRKLTHETTFHIGEASVFLKVKFGFTRGCPATGPSYASGGEPACPAEVDIDSLEWTRDASRDRRAKIWHPIDGALFRLISDDEELYGELCQAAEDDDADARESAAEFRAEMRREELMLEKSK